MKPLPFALAVVLLAGAPPMAASRGIVDATQEAQAPAPPPARARAAVPRRAAPERSEPSRQNTRAERGSRGTDREGRVRALPRASAPPPTVHTPPPAPPARAAAEPQQAERARGTDDRGRVRAVPRAPTPPPITFSTPEPRREASVDPGVTVNHSASSDDDGQRRAVPRGSRPRGDNRVTGRAVPRDGRYPGSWSGGRDRRGVYTSRGRVYNSYHYYYPRRYYPYGYGAFGLGYFYYDPYTWYAYDPYWRRPYAYSGGYYRSYGGSYYDTGELRLQVVPRHAEVYVDGYFAGHVDDFDGVFQALRLEEGPYRIEIVAPGYEPLEIDIRILPGRKVTYRGELRPRP